MEKLEHLSEITNSYDTYIVDLWGVMHNGIKLNSSAINTIRKLFLNDKKIVFLSNAPRPSINVVNFLKKLKMDDKYLKNVLTSGEAALKAIREETFGKRFYHLGPERDNSLFKNLEKNKTNIKECDYILCTGLFDDFENDLNYYRELLKKYTSKKLICTNPDLIVHRGEHEEYCAGKLASIFEDLGGEVKYFGKPYRDIYKLFLRENERALAIGDNLRTDIKGANNMNIDSIFITDGVHRSELKNESDLTAILKKYKVRSTYFQKELSW